MTITSPSRVADAGLRTAPVTATDVTKSYRAGSRTLEILHGV